MNGARTCFPSAGLKGRTQMFRKPTGLPWWRSGEGDTPTWGTPTPDTAEEVVYGRLTIDEALASLDRNVDQILEKRRWMLSNRSNG